MIRICALAALCVLVASFAVSADPPLADGVSGAPVTWGDYVAKRGPLAVLVWASWAPESDSVMDRHADIAAACREAGLNLVVLDVQETLEDGRSALLEREVGWLHDRHGALLKQYRVITIPSLLLVSPDGDALARLDPTARSVRSWSTR
jgi:hypothetical protein